MVVGGDQRRQGAQARPAAQGPHVDQQDLSGIVGQLVDLPLQVVSWKSARAWPTGARLFDLDHTAEHLHQALVESARDDAVAAGARGP